MRLTKIMAASLVSLSLTAVPAIAAEKSASKASVKADVRKASKLRKANRQEEEAAGGSSTGYIVAGVAIIAIGAGIAVGVGGDSDPQSP